MSDILFHLWMVFILLVSGGSIEMIRRLRRRARISRGNLE